MLDSLLPGVRRSRSEFASGLLIVGTVWLIGGESLGAAFGAEASTGLVQLTGFANGWAAVAVILGVAFVCGSVWTVLVGVARDALWHRHISLNLEPRREAANEISDYTYDIWRPFSFRSHRRLLSRLDLLSRDVDESAIDVDGWKRQVLRETLFVGPAILSSNIEDAQSVYDEVTRSRSEGELRDAISIPMATFSLSALLASGLTPAAKVVLGVVCILSCAAIFLIARKLTRDSNSQVAHSVAAGLLETTSMELVKQGSAGFEEFSDGRFGRARKIASTVEAEN